MLRRLTTFGLTLAAVAAVGIPTDAQERPESPQRQVQRRFAETSPDIGEPLPDVSAYDAGGKPFRLASLKGSYTVLVFGCLT